MRTSSRSNVRGWLALALPALLPVVAMAEPLVLEAPAPEPPTATAPAANPLADPQAANGKILVLPFQPVNPADSNAWVGKSVQESVVADLTVSAPGRVASSDQIAASLDAAIALGKQHGARYVVAGGFVTVQNELRITGQVLDVETGKAIAGLKVTGNPGDIFRMEDGLAMQVKARLMPGQQPMAPPQPPQFQAPAPPEQPPAFPTQPPIDSTGVRNDYPSAAPDYSSYATAPAPTTYGADSYYPYPDTSYANPYCYPSYGYGYSPYCDYGYVGYPYGFGLNFGFGFGRNHFDRGRDFGLRNGFRNNGFNNGFGNFRSPAISRGASSFRASIPNYRSSSIFNRSSFSHSSSLGGFHSSGFSHSFSGASHSGGSFHSSGGGFHSSGHSGGGHGGHR